MFINFFKKFLKSTELVNINISTDLVVLPIFGLFICLFLVSIINIFLILIVLEILSFIIIGLCVFNLSEISLESSIKYFVFNTIVSGITMFGMFCLYYILKNFNLIFLSFASDALYDLFLVGEFKINYYFMVFSTLMFIFIFLFKLNMFPVCFYILDVYESLPFCLIFFLSSIIKPCIFFLFVKIHIL
jgi:NADH:ubiquinone oxidoreductase subunit 2 (subunit N)